MKRLFGFSLIVSLIFITNLRSGAQEDGRPVWQVTGLDITANIQQAERSLNSNVILAARNVGRGSGSTLTFRVNAKAVIKGVTIGGAAAPFRAVPEARGNLQRITVTLPTSVASGGTLSLAVTYTLPVENNTGQASISSLGSQFLPLSFWYPITNSPFTVRGIETSAFRLSVSGATTLSSGLERSPGVFEQPLSGQPFFVQGEWERIEGTGEGKGITFHIPKGSGPEELKQVETILALAARARSFYVAQLGPAPDMPVRLVAVRRGGGFNDSGTILVDTSALRRSKIDSSTALQISEAIARLWVGGQAPVRGEGSGLLRDALVRYVATVFIEKQFGRESAQAEIQRERLAYLAVAKRDSPLSRATPLDDTYFGSVPNKGAMVWRLVERRLGLETFMNVLRSQVQAGKDSQEGLTLASFRAALVERGGQPLQALLDQQLDQVTDMDLMVGLPQLRGADWVSALRNLGSIDATVTVTATTEQGNQLSIETTIPAKNFAEAVFKAAPRLVRVEVDPEKLYPQLDYANDIVPRGRDLTEALAEANRQFGAQDFQRAETVAREIMATAPRLQEARMILARALLGQGKLDEAERLFRSALEEQLPTASTLAWANIGLGEISLRRGQAAEAARRFNEAVRADAEYASALAARAGRIKAESANSGTSPVDESARNFLAKFDQTITSGKKTDLESQVVSGELTRFVNGITGTRPEAWQTRVLRTEALDANLLAADVSIQTKRLGQEESGTALLVLSRTAGGWKLAGIELFEVR